MTSAESTSEHVMQTPYVGRDGQRTTACACGQRLTAPTIDELLPLMFEHVGRPAQTAVADTTRCAGCGGPTTMEHWPFCAACRQLGADVDPGLRALRSSTSSAALRAEKRGASSVRVLLLVLTAFATLGAALRFTGWLRLVIVLAAVVLFAVGLRLDARPPVRRE